MLAVVVEYEPKGSCVEVMSPQKCSKWAFGEMIGGAILIIELTDEFKAKLAIRR